MEYIWFWKHINYQIQHGGALHCVLHQTFPLGQQWHIVSGFISVNWPQPLALQVGGIAFIVWHVMVHWVMQLFFWFVISATLLIPPPKMVSTTRAATRMTTAVTTIKMVVERAFILSTACNFIVTARTTHAEPKAVWWVIDAATGHSIFCLLCGHIPRHRLYPVSVRITSGHLAFCYAL
jgi:hypothetical protein